MLNCPRCGAKRLPEGLYCLACGYVPPRACLHNGATITRTDMHVKWETICADCGHDVEED